MSWEDWMWPRVFFPTCGDDCWLWLGPLGKAGYGRLTYQSEYWAAHALVYVGSFGEIPRTMEIDHLCMNHRCVNPSHLEKVTHQENIDRATAHFTINGYPQGWGVRGPDHVPRRKRGQSYQPKLKGFYVPSARTGKRGVDKQQSR